MPLAIDASTPSFVANTVTSISTASFTPPVGSLLIVGAVSTPFSGNPNFVVTSTGLTFQPLPISNVAGQSTAQMFLADVGALGGSARTVSVSSSGFASIGLKVWVVTGQHATLYLGITNIGNTTANAFNAGITTDSAADWVFACGAEFNDLGAPTTTDVGEGVGGLSMSYLVVRKAAATTNAGPETLNFDSPGTSAAAWAWTAAAIRPDTYSPSSDASLWVPQTNGIILPDNPLYFPFSTLWAGADVTTQSATGGTTAQARSSTQMTAIKAASGAGAETQRSTATSTAAKGTAGTSAATGRAATGSTGLKITSGGTVETQRSATASTDRKTGIGVALDQTRTATSSAATKTAAGAAADQQRAATQSTGVAATGVSGPALIAGRSATSSTGKKLATSTSAGQQRTATVETGLKAAAGTGLDQQRSATRVTSLKAAAGTTLDQTRSATISTGGPVIGIGGAGRVASRSSTASTGRKTTTGAGAVTGRTATAGTGVHRASGVAVAASRTQAQTSGRRAASGAARVTQRCTLGSSGAQFALYMPIIDPVSAIRRNRATAVSRRNTASAAVRTNPAEAEA